MGRSIAVSTYDAMHLGMIIIIVNVCHHMVFYLVRIMGRKPAVV